MMTPAAIKVLRDMAENPELDIAQQGIQIWLGNERQISYRTFKVLINHLAISQDGDGSIYWHINGSGESIARRPELADEIVNAIYTGKPFTIENDKIKTLSH